MQTLQVSSVSFLAALLLVLPGVPLALWLRRRPNLWTLITDSILWSIAIDSAIFWLAPLQRVRLDVWLWLLLLWSGFAFVVAIRSAPKIGLPQWHGLGPYRVGLAAGAALAIACYCVVALVRPNIEWDAVNYYLLVATGFAKSGHVGYHIPAFITLAPQAPMSVPPVVPVLYALAISLASFLHATGDQAVRLIPVAFLVAIWAATRRIGASFLPALYAECAAFLFLTLPAAILYMTATPLYLDMAVGSLLAVAAAELVAGDRSLYGVLRLGIACMLLIATKVTGAPLVAMGALITVAFYVGGWAGRSIVIVTLLTIGLISWRYGLLIGGTTAWSALAIAVYCAAVVVSVPAVVPRRAARIIHIVVWCVAIAPALWIWFRISEMVGLGAFYLANLTHIASPNWEWAWRTIRDLSVLDAASSRGPTANAGLGIFLWWGFAPVTNFLAVLGFALGARTSNAVRFLGGIYALYALAWLTVFHATEFRNEYQFREFTPLLFVGPLLAAYAIHRLTAGRQPVAFWTTAALSVFALGYFWSAQQTFFSPPQRLLDWLAIASTPNAALVRIAAFTAAGFAVLGFYWARARRRSAEQRPHSSSAAYFWAVPTLGLIIVTSCLFEPLIATACTPGFSAQYRRVRQTEIYGYLPVLDGAIGSNRGSSILTFVGYGVTWYSGARYRWIDLTDAFALGLLKPTLSEDNPSRLLSEMEQLGVVSVILPSPGNVFEPGMQRLTEGHGLLALTSLRDPLLAHAVDYGSWTLVTLYERDGLAPPGLARIRMDTRGPNTRAFSIEIPASTVGPGTQADVLFDGSVWTNAFSRPFSVMKSGPARPRSSITLEQLLAGVSHQTGVAQSEMRGLGLRSIRLQLRDARDRVTPLADWRAAELTLRLASGRAISTNRLASALINAADRAPLGMIELTGGMSRFELFPGAPLQTVEPARLERLNIALRSSPDCKSGSRLLVSVSGELKELRRKELVAVPWTVRSIARANAMTRVSVREMFRPLSGRHAAARMFEVDSVVVRGLQATCPVREEARGDRIQFVSARGGGWEPRAGARALIETAFDLQPARKE